MPLGTFINFCCKLYPNLEKVINFMISKNCSNEEVLQLCLNPKLKNEFISIIIIIFYQKKLPF